MKRLPKNIALLLALTSATLITLLSCGGGGGGGGQASGKTSTIRGHVAGVSTALAPMGESSSMLARLKEFISFPKTANAQGSECVGITVTAQQGGNTIATTTTDSGCNFQLAVSPGNVTLIFITSTLPNSVSTVVVVPANSVVIIVVILQPTQVVVQQNQLVHPPISCETGTVNVTKETGTDFVVDGGGEACISAKGNCAVNLDPENIVLQNCGQCIDARGTAQVSLTANDGSISCDAGENGINTVGNAVVNLSASDTVTINSGQNGIQAVGNSSVNIIGTVGCTIQGGEKAIQQQGNATVNTDGCNLIGGGSQD
jgi:hypothetical protein